MSFRERIAWAAFVTTVIAWGGYFAVVIGWAANGGGHSIMLLWLFIAVTIAQAVLLGAAAAVSAIRAPGEANAPVDERDRVINRRASATAYTVVLLAIAVVIVWLHLGLHGTGTIFALIGVFILGEATRFGTQALGYRKAS